MKLQKLSSRAQRMAHFKKLHSRSGLNLVSLMDIFTILVFFLLVSSSNVQQLPNSKKVSLPASVAEKSPKETLVITVTKSTILVQGVNVVKLSDVVVSNEQIINELVKELDFHSSKTQALPGTEKIARSITIMGDENIPYQILRKILASCRNANYTNIAFAAIQKAKASKS